MKKRVTGVILSFVLFLGLMMNVFLQRVYAASGSGTMSIDQSTVIAGNNVTVSVSLNASNTIIVGTFTLNYDSSLFDFVGTTGPASTSAPSGAIPFQYDPAAQSTKMDFTVTFTAKGVGNADFSISDVTVIVDDPDTDVARADVSFNSVSCTVMAAGSDDATLSDLSVSGAALSPAFSKWTQDYKCSVPNNVTSVNISATSSQGGKIDISGNPGNLNVGDNYVTVTSYAPNGKTMKYNINIYRQEPETTAPTNAPTEAVTEKQTEIVTEEETEKLSDVDVEIGNKKFKIKSNFADSLIPDGFYAGMSEYNGKQVRAVLNDRFRLMLFYIAADGETGSFYIYNESEKSFYKFFMIDTGTQKLVVMDYKNADVRPAGCKEGEQEVCKVPDVPVLVRQDDKNYVYFYALNQNGQKNWYSYDVSEKTVQRLSPADLKTGETQEETQTHETETYNQVIESLNDDISKLAGENQKLKNIRNIAIAAGGVLLVATLVVLISLSAQKSEKKHSVDVDSDDLVNGDFERDDKVGEDKVIEENKVVEENKGEEEAVILEDDELDDELLDEADMFDEPDGGSEDHNEENGDR